MAISLEGEANAKPPPADKELKKPKKVNVEGGDNQVRPLL